MRCDLTDRQTHTHTDRPNYSNPRWACAPRVNKSKHSGHSLSFPALSIMQSTAHSSCSHLLHAYMTQSFPDFFWTSSSYVVKHTQHLLWSISSTTRTFFNGGCAVDLVLTMLSSLAVEFVCVSLSVLRVFSAAFCSFCLAFSSSFLARSSSFHS